MDVSCGFGYWEPGATAQGSLLATGASEYCKFTVFAKLHGNFWICPESFVYKIFFPSQVYFVVHGMGQEQNMHPHIKEESISLSLWFNGKPVTLYNLYFSLPWVSTKANLEKNKQEREVSS